MQISPEYQAFLKAADTIESDADRYNFMQVRKPRDETDSGCLLGWVGFYLGVEVETGRYDFAYATAQALKLEEGTIYLAPEVFYGRLDRIGPDTWRDDHKAAALALRAYADKYYKETA